MRHISYQEEHYGKTKLSAILARKHLLWYTKGFPSSKGVRDLLNRVEDLTQAREILKDYALRTPKDFIRFTGFSQEITSDYDPKYEMDRNLDRGVGDEGMDA